MHQSREYITIYGIGKEVAAIVHRYPVVLIPFFLLGLFDTFLLVLLAFVPHPLFSTVMSPLIRYFGGEQIVHSPTYYLYLPKLFGYCRDIGGMVVGVLLTGCTVMMVYQASQNKRPDGVSGLKKTAKRYSRFVAIWITVLAGATIALRTAFYFENMYSAHSISGAAGFLSALLLQMFFIFAIPAVAIENRKYWAAVKRSFAVCKQYPAQTFIIVVIPNLLAIPIIYIYTNIETIVRSLSPHVVLYVLEGRILLLAVINFMVLSSATVFFLSHREREKQRQLVA